MGEIILCMRRNTDLGLVKTNEKEQTMEEAKAELEDGSAWNVERMQQLAKVQKVHNENAFGPVTEDTLVIAIQGINPASLPHSVVSLTS